MSSKILIQNATIVTLGRNNKVLHKHSLLIENDKISKIAPDATLSPLASQVGKVINGHGKVVMPGFINAHMHFYSSFARGLGKAAPSHNFPEVLKNLWWRLDKKLVMADNIFSAKVALVDAIKKGTTTIIDHHASPMSITGSLSGIAKAVREAGLRANLCYEVSDRDGMKISQEGLEENTNFIKESLENEKKGDDQIRALFGLHASFTLQHQTLEAAMAKIQGLDTGFHIHCAEDKSDQEVTMKLSAHSVVNRLKNLGMLGKKTICAHCVHVDESEIAALRESETIVVHNPQSNMNNAVGVANTLAFAANKLLHGLGTDAMTNNMMEELRSAMWIQKLKHQDPSVAFMETVNALCVNNPLIAERFWPGLGLGELKEGHKADIILIDYFTPTEFSDQTFFGHLVFGLAESSVDTTIANGKILMENKKLTSINEEEIMGEAYELSQKLWERF